MSSIKPPLFITTRDDTGLTGVPPARERESGTLPAADPPPWFARRRECSQVAVPATLKEVWHEHTQWRDRTRRGWTMSQTSASLSKRTIRRHQLREIVPLADTTIYDMEQRGEFPQRFYLTSRTVVWDLGEVEAWLEERRRASKAKTTKRAPAPDVKLRKTRPVKG
jgi:prophage regulatory protein